MKHVSTYVKILPIIKNISNTLDLRIYVYIYENIANEIELLRYVLFKLYG